MLLCASPSQNKTGGRGRNSRRAILEWGSGHGDEPSVVGVSKTQIRAGCRKLGCQATLLGLLNGEPLQVREERKSSYQSPPGPIMVLSGHSHLNLCSPASASTSLPVGCMTKPRLQPTAKNTSKMIRTHPDAPDSLPPIYSPHAGCRVCGSLPFSLGNATGLIKVTQSSGQLVSAHPLLGVTASTVLEFAGGSAESADPRYILTRGAKPAAGWSPGSGDGKASAVQV